MEPKQLALWSALESSDLVIYLQFMYGTIRGTTFCINVWKIFSCRCLWLVKHPYFWACINYRSTSEICFEAINKTKNAWKLIASLNLSFIQLVSGKDFGLFLTDEDPKKGVWLENGRTLDYYMLRNGVSVLLNCYEACLSTYTHIPFKTSLFSVLFQLY